MKKVLIIALALTLVASFAFAGIRLSKHDMSSSGGQTTRSTNQDDLCVFCHTPHGSNASMTAAPLWNRNTTGNLAWTVATAYSTSTLNSAATTPYTAAPQSLVCLSCHDGNVAGETLLNAPGSGTAGTVTWQNSNLNNVANLNDSSGLTNDHPIGVLVTGSTDPDIMTPTNANLRLFVNKVECATCHDVHTPGTGATSPFLAVSNAGSAMCLQCHNK